MLNDNVRPGSAVLNIKQLNSFLKQSTSMSSLLALCQQNIKNFDYIHAATAVTRAPALLNMDRGNQPDLNDFQKIVEIARGFIPKMQAQALSNFIYSLAKSGQYTEDKDLIRLILSQAKNKLGDFTTQELANTIWALAKLNYMEETFIKHLLKQAEPKLSVFKPQELSNTILALATLNYKNEEFIKQLLNVAKSSMTQFNSQDLANSIWALAKLNYSKDTIFIEQLVIAAKSELERFNPQELANTMWALATLKRKDKEFIEQLLIVTRSKLNQFNPQDLANTIWSLATLNYRDEVFIKQLLKEAEPKLKDFSPQALANTAWSLAVLDHSDAPSFLPRFLPLAYEMAEKDESICMYFLQYILSMEDGGHVTAEIKLDPQYLKFRRMCQEAAQGQQKTNYGTSRTHLEIFEAIRHLPGCPKATSERFTEDGFVKINIALQLSGSQKLAIEVDGPHHFLSDGNNLNGGTVLRNRLLDMRGWKVISISEWVPGLPESEQRKNLDLLANKLRPYF